LNFSFKFFNISTTLLNFSNIIVEGIFSTYESELVESSSISDCFVLNKLYELFVFLFNIEDSLLWSVFEDSSYINLLYFNNI